MKLSRRICVEQAGLAIDLLQQACPELSKARLKDALNKGAVLLRQGKLVKRLRRAQSPLQIGASLELHYDSDLLARTAEPAQLLLDKRTFSVWYKPPGVLSQGNEWGDHLSVLRQAEQFFQPARPVFLVHRLDREASGLIVIAHQKQCAADLGKLIAAHQMRKTYQVLLSGHLAPSWKERAEINSDLDGKASCTRFRVVAELTEPNRSLVSVDLISGRKHQIRRHFAEIGHPVMGDPQYGRNNKDEAGLGLQAVALQFTLPKQATLQVELPAELRRFAALLTP